MVNISEAYRALKANREAEVCFMGSACFVGSGWMNLGEFAEIQTNITVVRMRVPEDTYKTGDIFLMEGVKYIFARTEYGKYSMIRLSNGNRFLIPIVTESLGAEIFHKDLITQLFGNISDWEKVPN